MIRMRFGVLLIIAAQCLSQGTGKTDLWQRLASAKDADQLAAIARELDSHSKAHPRDQAAIEIQCHLAEAWARIQRHDESLRIYDEVLIEATGRLRLLALLGKARVHETMGEIDRAIALLVEVTRAPAEDMARSIMDADTTVNVARRSIARCQETLGDWSSALKTWEAWTPSSKCANELIDFRHARCLGLARCRFNMGDAAGSLAIIEPIVKEEECINGEHPDIALIFAEYCAKSGRMAHARAVIAALPDDRRHTYSRALKLVHAWNMKDAAGILDGLPEDYPSRNLREMAGAAQLICELGDEAIAVLSQRIKQGQVSAIVVAGFTSRNELVDALNIRRFNESDGFVVRDIREAIERLRAAESRPTSRSTR